MKQHFTKYIPVKGQIKARDKVLDTRTGKVAIATHDYEGPREWFKKVKLFLVSRDIQVGDRINFQGVELICHSIQSQEEAGEGNRRQLFATEESYPQHEIPLWVDECFKVIGEISPDVLSYVKEGDEFDGEQVEEWWINKDISYFSCKVGTQPINDKHKYPKFKHFGKGFKIKGPCGHFH